MGILRLALAIIVLNAHLPIMGIAPPVSAVFHSFVAVCAFFMISGFYMALVLNETYGNRPFGIADFYLNRILRLYPSYWIVLVCYLVYRGFDAGLLAWAEQLAIFPHVFRGNLAFDPTNVLALGQMYTVGLEMMFYAMAPFVVRRSTVTLALVFAGAVIAHFLPWYLGLPNRPWQYEFFPAILVFFLAGTLSYRLYCVVRHLDFDRPWGYLGLVVLAIYNARFGTIGGPFTNALVPLAFYLLVSLVMPFLFMASKDSKIDRFLGDLSYPLYIVHYAVIIAIGDGHTSALFISAVSIALSIALVILIERPVDRFRHRLSMKRLLELVAPSRKTAAAPPA